MTLGIIQARMSSSRLPGKALKPLLGVPMLLVMVDRVMMAKRIDRLIVATSLDKSDDPIVSLCRENRIPVFRGSLDDVLDRFYSLADLIRPNDVVRMTGDCPMIDSDVIDKTVDYHVKGGFDYTRNLGWPDGLDVEVMTYGALRRAWQEAKDPYEREHVCPYFYRHPEIFKIGSFKNEGQDFSYLKISIDTQEDYLRVSRLLEILICMDSTFRIVRNF